MDLMNAINYRLVVNLTNSYVVDKYGYKEESEGLKYAKEEFANLYPFIDFNLFRDEIIVKWFTEREKKIKTNKIMKEVLNQPITNEEERKLYNKVTVDAKENYKKEILKDVPKIIIEQQGSLKVDKSKNEEVKDIKRSLEIIDNLFCKMMKSAKNKETFEFSSDEQEESIKAINYLEELRVNLCWEGEDLDDFLENYIRKWVEKLNDSEFNSGEYNDLMISKIKNIIIARQNIVKPKGNTKGKTRNKTSESILEKITLRNENKLKSMELKSFIEQYNELIELYDIDIKSMEGIARYFNLEDEYNLHLYINCCIEISEVGEKYVEEYSKLVGVELYLMRVRDFRDICNRINLNLDSNEDEIKSFLEKTKKLQELRNCIVEDLLKVKENEKLEATEVFEQITLDTLETLKEKLKAIDVEKYFDLEGKKKTKVFKVLKSLLGNNGINISKYRCN